MTTTVKTCFKCNTEKQIAEAVARERDRTVSEAPYRFLNESDTVLLREIVAEVQTAEHLRAEKETK